jgi:hypothetical protein
MNMDSHQHRRRRNGYKASSLWHDRHRKAPRNWLGFQSFLSHPGNLDHHAHVECYASPTVVPIMISAPQVPCQLGTQRTWIQRVARFPTVVSCAGWKCVKPKVGSARCCVANSDNREITTASERRRYVRPVRRKIRSALLLIGHV